MKDFTIKACMPASADVVSGKVPTPVAWDGSGNIYDWLRRTPAWRQLIQREGLVGLVAGYGMPAGQATQRRSVAALREAFGEAGSVWFSGARWYILNADGTRVGWAHV